MKWPGKSIFGLLLAVETAGAAAPTPAPVPPSVPHTIRFSGYDWEVRSDDLGGPGPNHWDSRNVRVDAHGALHLQITKRGDRWQCAELTSRRAFGFGRYEFQVSGPIDTMDRNVVLGLFNYTTPAVGPDGTNEIDIEYSHWGNPTYPLGNYTVYPARPGLPPGSQTFAVTPDTPDTTQTFVWKSNGVRFGSAHGFSPAARSFAAWDYRPADRRHVPQHPLPVHINLWLFGGQSPSDGREFEVVIRRFKFIPAAW